ncbi:MAG: prenyltransferase/squalene oxidase repeat-containing protein, partial [Candidatus Njordarchaeota archaeon]
GILLGIFLVLFPNKLSASEGIFFQQYNGNYSYSKISVSEDAWNISDAIEYIRSCQHVDGGFGSPGQISYLNYTSMALLVLGWLGSLNKIDLESAVDFMMSCYTGYGFGNILYPDFPDILSTWYGVKALWYLGRLDLIDVNAVKDYILSLDWDSTVTIALAVDILDMLNYIDLVDKDAILSYLTSNPPDGVNYADIGFLNTPTDAYPNIVSSWAGLTILYTLGLINSADTDKISEFIVRAQNSDGGFRSSEYSLELSRIDYTYFAVSSLRIIDKLDKGNMPFAALYATIVANTGDLGDVLYALLTLECLNKIMIPLAINVNSTVVSLGDRVNISLRLVDVYGETINNALTRIQIGNISAIFSEKNQRYELILDTRGLDNGTYNATIVAERAPYTKFRYKFNLTVLRCMYIGEIYYGGEIIVGSKTQLTLQITDRWGQSISGANVVAVLQDKKYKMYDAGGGIYIANITPQFPEKNATLIVRASKQGYHGLIYVCYVAIQPKEITKNVDLIPKVVAYGLLLLSVIVLARSIENGFLSLGYLVLLVALLDISGAFKYVNTDIILMGISISIILLVAHEERQKILGLLGLFVCVGIMGLLFGYAAYFLSAILFISAALAYIVSPGERNLILRDLAKSIVGWTITLISLSAGFMFLQNPFTIQGKLAPPAGIGISFSGYIAILWYSVFVFIPIITASKFAYIIAAGLRIKVSELYKRITGETSIDSRENREEGAEAL